jgi:hypothetical protein
MLILSNGYAGNSYEVSLCLAQRASCQGTLGEHDPEAWWFSVPFHVECTLSATESSLCPLTCPSREGALAQHSCHTPPPHPPVCVRLDVPSLSTNGRSCLYLPGKPGTRKKISKVEKTVVRESLEGFLEEALGGLQNVGEDWRRPGTLAADLCSRCHCDRAGLSKPRLTE